MVTGAINKPYIPFKRHLQQPTYGIRNTNQLTTNQAHENRVKNEYDKSVRLRIFSEGELVLLWDQDKEPMGAGNFRSMWLGAYIVLKVLKKGASELIDFNRNKLAKPRNGLYLKNYYA